MEVKDIEKKDENIFETSRKETKKGGKIKKIIITIISIIVIGGILLLGYAYYLGSQAILKPIIYLYPTEETEISVTLKYPEKITCSYPKYIDNWNVIAYPDGTLKDTKTNRELYSLYWEGKGIIKADKNEGFVVKGEDTAEFLEEKLEILGLNAKESEEFIIYWLPKMQDNKYNYIRFATMDEINEYMPLEFSVSPDSLIRVYMQYKPLNRFKNVTPQNLTTPVREGFTIVEWGGTEI